MSKYTCALSKSGNRIYYLDGKRVAKKTIKGKLPDCEVAKKPSKGVAKGNSKKASLKKEVKKKAPEKSSKKTGDRKSLDLWNNPLFSLDLNGAVDVVSENLVETYDSWENFSMNDVENILTLTWIKKGSLIRNDGDIDKKYDNTLIFLDYHIDVPETRYIVIHNMKSSDQPSVRKFIEKRTSLSKCL